MARVSTGWLFLLFAAPLSAQTIDLSDAGALEQLRASNPAHYEKVTQIVRGLREQPTRAEDGWLQVNFGAQEVELARLVMLTSYPPQQSVRFKLDESHYRLTVVRHDLTELLLELGRRPQQPNLTLQR